MSLTSTSTLSQVQAAYEDNADYDLVGSTSKARDFIQACRYLLLRLPAQSSELDKNVGLRENLAEIRSAMQRAEQWLQTNGGTDGSDSTGGVRYTSFEGFRE